MESKWTKKQLCAFLLAASMVVPMTMTATAAETNLTDIQGAWCEEYVNDLVGRGIVGGYADGTYKASTPVTRGAIAKMVFLSMQNAGSSIKTFTSNDPFTDMKGNWAEQYVVPLEQVSVIVPSEYNNKFSASTPMTRLETAKMLVRVYLHAHPEESLNKNAKLSFTDASEISAADAPYVAFAVEKGMITGYEDGSFKPSASINRGTAAAMMSRFLGKVGTIEDTVMGEGGSNRSDGTVNQDGVPAPQIENVEWVIKPVVKIDYKGTAKERFSEVSPDGMSCYWTNDSNQNPVFIDKNGKTYQYTNVSNVGNFVNGVAPAMDPKTKKCGYIDVSGKWVENPKWDGCKDFRKIYLTDGSVRFYGLVKQNRSWYAIDEKYQVLESNIIPNTDREKTYGKEYSKPSLANGYEVFSFEPTKDGLWSISAMKGEEPFRQPYYGICDSNGKILVAPKAATTSYGNDIHTAYYDQEVYDDCIVLTQQVSVQSDALCDIYDGKTGELIYTYAATEAAANHFGVDYRGVNDYGQGLFTTVTTPVDGDSGISVPVGYMDKYGNMKIPAVFEDATPFSNGYAWVKYNGAWGMIKLPE